MDIDIRNKVLVALAEFGSSEKGRGCIIPPIIFISFNIEAVLSIK